MLRTMFVNPTAGWAVAVNGLSLVDFINLGPAYLGADDSNGIRVSQTELLAFQVNPFSTDGGTFAVGSPTGEYTASYVNEGGFTTSFMLMIPFSENENSTLSLNIYEDDGSPESRSYQVPDVISVPISRIHPQARRGILYLYFDPTKPKTKHKINFPPFIRPQLLPLFGYSIIEGPGSAAFYYVTPANKVFCIQGLGCIRQGIGNNDEGLY